jgi:PIN domain nuclease of toxin-antitoxin system
MSRHRQGRQACGESSSLLLRSDRGSSSVQRKANLWFPTTFKDPLPKEIEDLLMGMKVLIDTQVLLWGSQRIGLHEWGNCREGADWQAHLSPACGDCLSVKLQAKGILVLQTTGDHVRRVEPLPLHHRDPFDGIPIAQSTGENPPAITADPLSKPYPAQIIG